MFCANVSLSNNKIRYKQPNTYGEKKRCVEVVDSTCAYGFRSHEAYVIGESHLRDKRDEEVKESEKRNYITDGCDTQSYRRYITKREYKVVTANTKGVSLIIPFIV